MDAEIERAFAVAIIPDNLLDQAVEWIKENLNPEDVFSEAVLESWALDNEFVAEYVEPQPKGI